MIPNAQNIRAAIVADLVAGYSYDEIIARNNVTRHRVRKIVASEGLERKSNEPKRARPCSFCGIETQAPSGMCQTCRASQKITWGRNDGLPPGRWVTRHGIKRYVIDDDPPPPFCGTEKGYQWHRNNDHANWPLPSDDPCGCRAAHREHGRRKAAA